MEQFKPPDVLHCNTLNTFKKHLKTHLFTSSLTSPDWPLAKRLWSSALLRYINVCIIIITIKKNTKKFEVEKLVRVVLRGKTVVQQYGVKTLNSNGIIIIIIIINFVPIQLCEV